LTSGRDDAGGSGLRRRYRRHRDMVQSVRRGVQREGSRQTAASYHPDVTIYEGGGINNGWIDYRDGFNEKGNPTSLTFVGRVFGDAAILALARNYQDATAWHLRHPAL
jgi:hypothetical protein